VIVALLWMHHLTEATVKLLRLLSPAFGLALALPLLAACGDRSEVAGGEVLGDSVIALDHELTSDNYTKWRRAQDALDSANVDLKVRLDSRRATAADIDRAIEAIEEQDEARRTIESVGFGVRDFVLTTLALAQSWDAVNRPSVRISGLRPENVEFLRQQAAEDPRVRTRPRARVLDDDSDDDDSDDSDRRRGRNRGRGGRDSDSDS
jgi:hypothetical protein